MTDRTFGVVADNLRAKAGEFKTNVGDRIAHVADAANTVKAGNSDMFGPLLTFLGFTSSLDRMGDSNLKLINALAHVSGGVAGNMTKAADVYEANEAKVNKKFKSKHIR